MMWWSLGPQPVRGSYSARVRRSSLARVHREFVHHILDDEVDGQDEGQDDKREDGEEREESAEQTHERMRMNHDKWCAHGKHTTWATHVRVIERENATCEVWCLQKRVRFNTHYTLTCELCFGTSRSVLDPSWFGLRPFSCAKGSYLHERSRIM